MSDCCSPATLRYKSIVRTQAWIPRGIAVLTFLLMFSFSISSMKHDSPTFDEQGFLVRGLAYLRGEENGGNRHLRVGHPLGLNALNAVFLMTDPSVRLPSDHPSWQETSFHRPAELFMWEIGNDVRHIMFVSRLSTVWLGLLLAAVGGRWAGEMAAGWSPASARRSAWGAGTITLLLLAFDPNIMAHMRLVTTDLGLTTAAVVAGYPLWRAVRQPTWRRVVIAGAGLGLLLNTKFTALLFLPLFGIVMMAGFLHLCRDPRTGAAYRPRVLIGMGLLAYPLIALLVLWAGNGFQMEVLQAPLPLFGQIGVTLPLSQYLDQLLDIGNRLDVSTPSFLLGHYSDSGWWYYFPVAFILKTPLSTLLLLGGSIVWIIMKAARYREKIRSIWFDLIALLIPAAGFFAIALATDINLGYRHLLPILPFLYVLIGVVAWTAIQDEIDRGRKRAAVAVGVALGWLIAASMWIYPHYLAFFNVLAGGPENGWRALVDSNLDWGQDLERLSVWLAENEIDTVWLSYFGEARPEYYGIAYRGLDSFPPRLMNPDTRPFYPQDPAPGWYAISATTLQGVHFGNHDQFAYFREQEPAAKIGYSIFLYNVPARGKAIDLLLGGIQVDELAARDHALFQTNDVRLRWFDPSQALILPDGTRASWLAVGAEEIDPLLAPFLEIKPEMSVTGGERYRLYRVRPQQPELSTGIKADDAVELRLGSGEVSFAGTPLLEHADDTLRVRTTWRQIGSPQPVKIFVHVLDEEGTILAQWDGLRAAWLGWLPGDTLIHTHEISTAGLPAGDYRVVAGLYDPESLNRWRSPSGQDAIELGELPIR